MNSEKFLSIATRRSSKFRAFSHNGRITITDGYFCMFFDGIREIVKEHKCICISVIDLFARNIEYYEQEDRLKREVYKVKDKVNVTAFSRSDDSVIFLQDYFLQFFDDDAEFFQHGGKEHKVVVVEHGKVVGLIMPYLVKRW